LIVCFEPRSSSSRRNVFFDAYTSAFDGATATLIGPVHAPERVPDGQVLDTGALARAIRARGGDARAFESVDALADAVLAQAVPGDTVLLLSSGAFAGLAGKILDGLGDAVVFADPDDAAAIDALLQRNGLPTLCAPNEVESLIIRGDDALVGCVSLQLGGSDAFLFGLAVDQARRGEGLGWVLADCAMRRARTLGARSVVLVPGAAAEFFADKLGFVTVSVDTIDPAIRKGADFAAWVAKERGEPMRLALPGEGET
jgi:UDP-N-acetylmuramate: L-alanyl-gamma-D-glutamyl-meso-diaminopimelate ligase